MAVRATASLQGRPAPPGTRRSGSRAASRCGGRAPPVVRASVDTNPREEARVAGDARRVPVLIIPGFLSTASEYEGMADALRRFDASADVSIVPLRAADWYPTLAGGTSARSSTRSTRPRRRRFAERGARRTTKN